MSSCYDNRRGAPVTGRSPITIEAGEEGGFLHIFLVTSAEQNSSVAQL